MGPLPSVKLQVEKHNGKRFQLIKKVLDSKKFLIGKSNTKFFFSNNEITLANFYHLSSSCITQKTSTTTLVAFQI